MTEDETSTAQQLAAAAARSELDLQAEQAAELTEAHVQVEAAGTAEAAGLDLTKAKVRDYGLKPLMVLFILNAVDEFDRSILAVALETLREYFQVSDTMISLLPLAFTFLAGVIGVPAGTWADRWVRKYIIAIGAVIWGGAGLLAAASRNFVQLFTTRMILGVGRGTIDPTHLSLLSDYYPVSIRGRVLGYHRAANPAGQVLGAVMGGALITLMGWRWAFVAAAVPGVVLGLYALSLREPKRGEADLDAATESNPLLAEFLKEPEDKKKFFESLGVIFKIKTLRYLIIANATIGFVLIGVVYWLPALFERRYGFTTAQAAGVLGALALASFIGTWYGSPRADKNVSKGFTYMAMFGTKAIAVIVIAWPLAFLIPNATAAIVLFVASTGVASYGVPGLVAVVAAAAPPRIRSQAFAAFGLALAVCGAAIAPLMIGWGSDLLQNMGVNSGDSLRYSMFACTLSVTGGGVWCVYLSSKVAAADVNKTIADFLAEMTQGKSNDAAAQTESV